jgi:putative polyhydroxyalkanoate system protein
MPTISIARPHKLDHKKARAAAKKIAKDLNKRFGLVCEWAGDDVAFERPGVSGLMRVGKTSVELEVKLSFLMTPLKASIEQAIRQELDTTFGKA